MTVSAGVWYIIMSQMNIFTFLSLIFYSLGDLFPTSFLFCPLEFRGAGEPLQFVEDIVFNSAKHWGFGYCNPAEYYS